MSLRFPFSPRWDAGRGDGGLPGGTRGEGMGGCPVVGDARFPFSRVAGEGVRGWGDARWDAGLGDGGMPGEPLLLPWFFVISNWFELLDIVAS